MDALPTTPDTAKQEILKAIIRDLHAGVSRQEIKKRFRELARDVSAEEIGRMEQALIREGMPESEIKGMCDVHVEIFRDSLAGAPKLDVPEGHPVADLMAENRAAEAIAGEVLAVLEKAGGSLSSVARTLDGLLATLARIDLHYVKKENELFPVLESLGISGPPKVMWAHHDDIRALIKAARAHLAAADDVRAQGAAKDAAYKIRDMVFKEEHILFPMSLGRLSAADWIRIARGCREIGYAWVEPTRGFLPEDHEIKAEPKGVEHAGVLNLGTGRLTPEVVDLLLRHLPFDVSFVDAEDRVQYYSEGKERIFPRSPGVIGRNVENCHPPKSVHIVREILDRFRSGGRDVAEFWIELGGKFLYIRYFAVRDQAGTYKGCLEVMQDVTRIRSLQGQRRLLEWN
jgi:DUF438 domain-containing protein